MVPGQGGVGPPVPWPQHIGESGGGDIYGPMTRGVACNMVSLSY